jgi:uncharacterized membrane protein YkvA (DUF1232 family)
VDADLTCRIPIPKSRIRGSPNFFIARLTECLEGPFDKGAVSPHPSPEGGGWLRAERTRRRVGLGQRDRTPPGRRFAASKALALCVAAYALSPIELIPDFVPVLGYLDDLILVPLGIAAAVRMIPPDVMAEHRTAAPPQPWRPSAR